MAANITISTLDELGATKYSRKALFFAQFNVILAQFGQAPENMDLGWKDMVYTRFVPIPQTTAFTDVTSAGTFTAAKKTKTMQVKVVPELHAQGEDFDLFDVRRMFLNYVAGASKIYGDWAGKQINYYLVKEVSKYATHIRADLEAVRMVSGTCTDVGSTTTVNDDVNLTQADDYWNGGYITMTSGEMQGITGTVSDFDNSTTIATIDSSNGASAGFPQATAVGDTFRITVQDDLAEGDILDAASVKRAVRILKQNEAPMWEGYYMGYLDAANEDDFLTDMTETAKYTERGIKKIFENEIGIAYGVRWVRGYEVYREIEAGTEDRTDGVISNVLIFGRDAFGEIPVAAGPAKPKVMVKTPGKDYTGVVAADAELQGFVGIKAVSAPKMLNAMYCVSILTYPTSV